MNSKVLASTLHAEPAEQPIGHAPIGFDLLPQRVDVRKLTLVPDALHESQPHGTAVEIARVVEADGSRRSTPSRRMSGRTPTLVMPACTTPSIVVVVA